MFASIPQLHITGFISGALFTWNNGNEFMEVTLETKLHETTKIHSPKNKKMKHERFQMSTS